MGSPQNFVKVLKYAYDMCIFIDIIKSINQIIILHQCNAEVHLFVLFVQTLFS